MYEKECAWCGLPFMARSNRQKFCSMNCRDAAKRQRDSERDHQPQSSSTSCDWLKKFEPVQAFIDEYKSKTGKLLSYGKAEVMMGRKKK